MSWVESENWSVPAQGLNYLFGPFERYGSPTIVTVASPEFTDDDLRAVCELGGNSLRAVEIKGQQITDGGIAHFRRCSDLADIELDCPNVTDDGLVALESIRGLRSIAITSDQVTGSFVAELHKGRWLETLELHGPKIDDRACTAASEFEQLAIVVLSHTAVTDKGLMELANIRTLRYLNVVDSKVSEEGARQFGKAKPGVDFHSDLKRHNFQSSE